MPLSRKVLERQVAVAQSELSAWIARLTQEGVNKAGYRKDAKWRTLNAKHNQIQRRLASLAQVEANDAAVAERKAAPPAAEPEKKPAAAAKAASKKPKSKPAAK